MGQVVKRSTPTLSHSSQVELEQKCPVDTPWVGLRGPALVGEGLGHRSQSSPSWQHVPNSVIPLQSLKLHWNRPHHPVSTTNVPSARLHYVPWFSQYKGLWKAKNALCSVLKGNYLACVCVCLLNFFFYQLFLKQLFFGGGWIQDPINSHLFLQSLYLFFFFNLEQFPSLWGRIEVEGVFLLWTFFFRIWTVFFFSKMSLHLSSLNVSLGLIQVKYAWQEYHIDDVVYSLLNHSDSTWCQFLLIVLLHLVIQ